jgi:hypothetical protein
MLMYWWLLPFFTAISSLISSRIIFYFLFHPAFPVKIGRLKIQGIVPLRMGKWERQLTESIVNAVAADKRLTEYLTAPSTLQPMMPFIEMHIDEFLRHKLGKAMPIVSMFVGDKTINQMKGVFMNELETLLPAIIRRFLEESMHPDKLRPLIYHEIQQLRQHKAFLALQNKLEHQLITLSWIAGVVGFITGLLLSGVVYGINSF